MKLHKTIYYLFLTALFLLLREPGYAQPLTGVWRGKIHVAAGLLGRSSQLELKLVRNGDSLTGSSYYFSSGENYTRYQVKGYVNPFDGTVTWWDEQLIEGNGTTPNKKQQVSTLHFVTDFNCPGEGIMKLDGEAEKTNEPGQKKIPVHLNKVDDPLFADEWDYVLDNFARGANDPSIIDSIEQLIVAQKNHTEKQPVSPKPLPEKVTEPLPVPPAIAIRTEPIKPVTKPALTVEEMFVSRKKVLVTEIPLSGDSVELRFYDHAEIDGDSISLFLNNKLLQKNILLKASPYIVKLPVAELEESNELIMVAENLGSIPPNTSLMIAYINEVRYEARLESTENSSAMIRFFKQAQAAKTASPRQP
jgi:hypothetical protein